MYNFRPVDILFFIWQAKSWIDEKMKIMGDDSMQEMNLQEKMKKLQKHQAFEAEILANEELIVAVQRVSIIGYKVSIAKIPEI